VSDWAIADTAGRIDLATYDREAFDKADFDWAVVAETAPAADIGLAASTVLAADTALAADTVLAADIGVGDSLAIVAAQVFAPAIAL